MSHTHHNEYSFLKRKITSIATDVGKLKPTCLWKSKITQPLHRTVWKLLRRLNVVPVRPSNSTPTYVPKESWKHVHTKTCIWISVALFTITEEWKQAKSLSTDECSDEMWCIHLLECYSTVKTHGDLKHAITRVNLEKVRPPSEGSQTQ